MLHNFHQKHIKCCQNVSYMVHFHILKLNKIGHHDSGLTYSHSGFTPPWAMFAMLMSNLLRVDKEMNNWTFVQNENEKVIIGTKYVLL